MNLTIEQLAEVLAGIAKAQQAIIDGIESNTAGWRNVHLTPKLTTASNMRLATPRLMDVPSRILLRSQTRVPMDVATITRMLHEAVSGEPVPKTIATEPVQSPTRAFAPPAAAPIAPAAAAGAVAAASAPSTPTGGADDLSNFFDT
jgi:hypothetical protein